MTEHGRLIDADALEKDGWMMHRTVQVDKATMSYQTKKPTDFPTIKSEAEWVEIIRCKDCKYYIPYEWMFDGLSRSSHIEDYSPDEIGCSVNYHNYPPDGYCSCAERREE